MYFLIYCLPIFMSSYLKPIDIPQPTTINAETITNVSYGSHPKQKMDIYLPANRTVSSTKVLIILHGGGWNSGDKSNLAIHADNLRKRLPDYAIFNINYRLAVNEAASFPAQENDVKAALNFIYNRSSDYLISDKYVLLGISAGAHLALLQGYKYSTPVRPKAIISFFGPTDLTNMYNNPSNPYVPYALLSVTGKTPLQDSLLYAQSSPVNFVKSSSPPTLILHGGLDPLVKSSQSFALISKLKSAGVKNQIVLYATEGHGWFGINLIDSFNKIESFLHTNVN